MIYILNIFRIIFWLLTIYFYYPVLIWSFQIIYWFIFNIIVWILFLIYLLLWFNVWKWNQVRFFKWKTLIFSYLYFIWINVLYYFLIKWKSQPHIDWLFEVIFYLTHPFFNSIFLIFENIMLLNNININFKNLKWNYIYNIQKISILMQIIILFLITIFTWKYFLFWNESDYDLFWLNLILLTWFNILIVLYIIFISLYSYFKLKNKNKKL